MKILKTLTIALFLVGVSSTLSFAGVTFLPGSSYGSAGSANSGNTTQPSQQDSETRCKNAGYYYTSCGENEVLTERCPYDSSYYRDCCETDYKYTRQECLNAGLSYSRKSCGGLYKCL